MSEAFDMIRGRATTADNYAGDAEDRDSTPSQQQEAIWSLAEVIHTLAVAVRDLAAYVEFIEHRQSQ